MTHEEDDDQGERLINEGKKKLENKHGKCFTY